MDKKSVVLLSGGIDSSTTAAIAKAEGYDIYALSFDYGQRHRLELESAKKVAENLCAKKHLIIKFDLREIGGSALTADIEVPKGRKQKTEDRGQSAEHREQNTEDRGQSLFSESLSSDFCLLTSGFCSLSSVIPVTYVPARNTIFLSFALGWAEVLEAPDIFIGANAVDYSGYPDCRPEYLKAFEEMANLATRVSVEGKIKFKIKAPLLYMTKGEIIRKGTEMGFDYSLTWSCYDPQARQNTEDRTQKTEHQQKSLASDFWLLTSKYVPCGRCDSCIFRAKGFREAGIKDPLNLFYA